MAAATGYSDAPTDEQLLAYAELPRHGRYMAEVFAVRILATAGGDPPPHGTITFYGGHCCSDFIYSWSPLEEGEDTSKQTCDSQEEHDNMVDVVREIFEEMSIPEDHEAEFVVSSLNHEQRHAYDVILSSVENISGGVFFVDGPGGTGKTCMYKALLSTVRRSGKIAIATATSGVAASIMPGGRTASDSLSSCILVPKQGNLVLTGPSWATSAYSPIAFTLYLHDGSPQAGEAAEDDEDIGRIICDCIDGDFSNYNRAIVETVQTGYGPAEVIYAVLSNGVQGRVAIKLARLPVSKAGEEDATAILGRIVARSKLFDVGCVLFYKEGDNGVSVRPGGLIQLAREALAVPLHMPLTIELDLHRCSGDEIVGGVLEFNPATNGQHTERLVGENGAELEVTISWSQYPW
ncbi:60 kDa jasmonate-induced protein [Zea mays]|uniref:ATP-dependent DNA helicase n=1 Tax=Zea mays TaxID=4577 RepID=A0A1D6EGC9_MAIZE|nr:60 kDa jasmonate-induced protein [Zea mays]